MSQDINKIKNLINQSTLLNSSEKTEWLNLLGNMNDKQLMELEEILNPSFVPPKVEEKPKPTPIIKPEAVKPEIQKPVTIPEQKKEEPKKEIPVQKPSLSHITNLPQGLGQAKVENNKPKVSSEFKKHLDEVLTEKELPVGHPEAVKPITQSPIKPTQAPNKQPPKVTEPVKTETVHKDEPEEKIKPIEADSIELPNSLADIALVKPNVIRAYKLPQLLERFKQLVAREGYFEVQVSLEQSPLYKLYLYTGSRMLEQNMDFSKLAEQLQIEHRDYFTRTEFEYVSDLLKGIQIN